MPRKRQIEFIRLWASLKQNGLPDKEIVISLLDDYQKILGNCPEVKFCQSVIDELQNWSGGFHQAMRGWFDNDLILLVKTTRSTDNVTDALKDLLSQTLEWQTLKKAIIREMWMNGLFLLFAFGLFVFISTTAIHMIVGDAPKHNLGSTVITLIGIGNWIKQYGILTILLFVIGLGTLIYMMYTYTGEHRAEMDRKVPFYGFYSANEASGFFSMLNVMVTGGKMPLRAALEELQSTNLVSKYISSHIDEMLYRLKERKSSKEGSAMSFDKLDTGLLPARLRLRLSGLSKQKKAEDKQNIMHVIAKQLTSDYGDALLVKVSVIGKTAKYTSGGIVIFSILSVLDVMFSKISNMAGM